LVFGEPSRNLPRVPVGFAGHGCATAGFTSFIYAVTWPFAQPFIAVFRPTVVEGKVFEWTTFLAMVVYLLVAWGVISLFTMSKTVSTPEAAAKLDK